MTSNDMGTPAPKTTLRVGHCLTRAVFRLGAQDSCERRVRAARAAQSIKSKPRKALWKIDELRSSKSATQIVHSETGSVRQSLRVIHAELLNVLNLNDLRHL